MPTITIVSDDILSSLLAGRSERYGNTEVDYEIESTFGFFDPSPELLRTAIDAVFWASLSAEEGKPALTRVQFTDIRDPQSRLEPHPISAAALRKLSPLMDEFSNVLYVRKDANIVGVGVSLLGISVVAQRPGHLAVIDETNVIGVFDQGNWVIVGGSEINFSQILRRALPDESFPEQFLKATLVVRFAMAARRTERGATFILVPADRQDGIGSVSYPVEAFPALPQALDAWREARRTIPLSTLEQKKIQILVDIARAVVAAGAGIDGATLIDSSNLHLLGFGAKISANNDELEVALIELPNTEVRKVKKRDLGGMRHQSAARLVQQNHEAIVITVSQDGPISLFAWVHNDETVVVFKHLDRYLVEDTRFRP